MIQSAMSLRSLRSQSIDPFHYYQKNNTASIVKRKFENNTIEDTNDNDDQSFKRKKLCENDNNDYITKEIELDINANFNKPQDNEYVTKEFDIDFNDL